MSSLIKSNNSFEASAQLRRKMAFDYSKDSFQVYLSSDGCRDIYPNNSSSHFKVRLKTPRELKNIKEKWRVCLAEFAYDAEGLYNFGENTDTFCQVYVGGNSITITPDNIYVRNAKEAADSLNEAVKNAEKGTIHDFRAKKISSDEARAGVGYNEIAKSSHAEPIHVEFPVIKLDDHIRFDGGSKNDNICTITLKDVDDFGASPMLRKMLGLHFTDKFSSDHYAFRMRARDFTNEISNMNDYQQKEIEDFVSIFDYEKWGAVSFTQRNDIYKRANVDYMKWLVARGDELENDLDAIISDKKYMYDKFLINRYRKDELERKADFIFQLTDLEGYLNVDFSDVRTYKREKLFLPFSCWSKIEFLLCAIFEPLFVTPQTVFTPRHKFNPNLFSVLYIYSNIVDLVAVNDGNFRLLSTVFLKGDSKSTIKRELIENKSQLYKFLHIDVIDEIEIVILTSLGKPAPFIHGPVYVTLDFKNFHHGQ